MITVKVLVVQLKHILPRKYLKLLNTIFLFVIKHYHLIVCVDFSLLGYNPTVSQLLAGIPMCIANDVKGLCQWGDDLENDFVDYSVRKKVSY